MADLPADPAARAMRQKIQIIIGVACLVVASAAATAGISNAMQPPVPQADGVTVGGMSLSQLANWVIAGLGGAGGIWQLILGLAKRLPNVGPIVDIADKLSKSDIGDAVLGTLPAILVNIDADPNNDKPVPFSVTRKLGRGTVQLTVLWTPEAVPPAPSL